MLDVNKEMIHNAKERFLEIQPNGAGLYIGMETYKTVSYTHLTLPTIA